MDAITARLEAREVDWYPKLGVFEWALEPGERLVTLAWEVPLPVPDALVL